MGNAEYEADARAALLNKFGRDWTAFNSQVAGFPIPQQPELLSDDRASFRVDFMQEELDEFCRAHRAGDLDGVVDACIDFIYVTVGALGEMGVLTQPTWDEVQRANMAKKRGTKSTRPGSKGFDAIKPEGWKAPSHADYLTITSEEVRSIIEQRLGGERMLLTDPAEMDTIEALRKGEAKVVPVRTHTVKTPLPETKFVPLGDLGNPKLLIMGYARHGKDTVCERLRDLYGFRFTSSSQFAAERVVFPALRKCYAEFTIMEKPGVPIYETPGQCFEDRANHRKLWYDLITAYNTPDLTRLGRDIFEGHDVYCGIRNAREFHALKNADVFDVAIWVDASGRGMPAEGKDSCTVEPWMADFVLDNSGSLEDLKRSLSVLMGTLIGAED